MSRFDRDFTGGFTPLTERVTRHPQRERKAGIGLLLAAVAVALALSLAILVYTDMRMDLLLHRKAVATETDEGEVAVTDHTMRVDAVSFLGDELTVRVVAEGVLDTVSIGVTLIDEQGAQLQGANSYVLAHALEPDESGHVSARVTFTGVDVDRFYSIHLTARRSALVEDAQGVPEMVERAKQEKV